jgi:ribosome production factor 2
MKKKKTKNQSTNVFGEVIGRLHLEKQDVEKMGGRKSKALRRAEKAAAEEERQAVEKDLQREEQALNDEFQQTYGYDRDQE